MSESKDNFYLDLFGNILLVSGLIGLGIGAIGGFLTPILVTGAMSFVFSSTALTTLYVLILLPAIAIAILGGFALMMLMTVNSPPSYATTSVLNDPATLKALASIFGVVPFAVVGAAAGFVAGAAVGLVLSPLILGITYLARKLSSPQVTVENEVEVNPTANVVRERLTQEADNSLVASSRNELEANPRANTVRPQLTQQTNRSTEAESSLSNNPSAWTVVTKRKNMKRASLTRDDAPESSRAARL